MAEFVRDRLGRRRDSKLGHLGISKTELSELLSDHAEVERLKAYHPGPMAAFLNFYGALVGEDPKTDSELASSLDLSRPAIQQSRSKAEQLIKEYLFAKKSPLLTDCITLSPLEFFTYGRGCLAGIASRQVSSLRNAFANNPSMSTVADVLNKSDAQILLGSYRFNQAALDAADKMLASAGLSRSPTSS